LIAQSPQKGTVTGIIIDGETRRPVSSATIRILHQKDSTLITGLSSTADGSFSVSVGPGAYITQISFIGYQDIFRDISVTPSQPSVRLDTISLYESYILLEEAVITARLPEIVVRGDTLEYNAGSYKVTEMAVVEDLLKEMTGVEIEVDGTIKVNGKEIKKILVDGKEFFSNDPKIASKSLPAKMVDKLQVLDNKSEMEKMTGFDDGVEEMVINLTVKPDMKRGAFGNAFAGYGSKGRYEANAMVNYMRNRDQMTFISGVNNTNNAGFSDLASAMPAGTGGGRGSRGGRGDGGEGGSSGITTSGNTGFNFNKEFSKNLEIGGNSRYGRSHTESISKTYTQNFLSKGDTYEAENDRSDSFSDNVNVDLHIEWKPDSLTSLVFRPNASFHRNERDEEGDFTTTRENGDTINAGHSAYTSQGSGSNFGGNLHLNRRLGKQGRSISIGLDAGINGSESRATNLSDTYYSGTRPDDLIDQRITNKNSGTNWRSSLSYVEPIGEQKFLQLSYNYRQNSSESDRDTRTQDEDGNYTVYDKQYSKLQKNSSASQDISLTFRSRREKYNYSVGFNIYPSTSKRRTFVGDSLINDLTQKVTNYSPNAQFNYMWTRQKNLRFTYNGSTDQPSVNQISPVTDITNPLNVTYGNPDLKPSFHHRIDMRYQNSQPENNRFYMLNANFNYTVDAIVTSRFTDQETGKKENTYMNVNGNWDAGMRFTTTQPIISKRFTVSTTTFTNYRRSNGFSNYEENVSKQINLSENLILNYNSNQLNLSVRGNISYNKVKNSLEGQQDREFFNYGTSANTSIYLPFDLNIQSDIRYSTNSGYADGFKQNEVLWNASLEKQILKQKNGIIRLKVYDILQQRSNIRRNVSSNFIRDTTTHTLTTYFIVHFAYRFNVFKGGAPRNDIQRRGNRGGRSSGRS
jgi:hypothetical protein